MKKLFLLLLLLLLLGIVFAQESADAEEMPNPELLPPGERDTITGNSPVSGLPDIIPVPSETSSFLEVKHIEILNVGRIFDDTVNKLIEGKNQQVSTLAVLKQKLRVKAKVLVSVFRTYYDEKNLLVKDFLYHYYPNTGYDYGVGQEFNLTRFGEADSKPFELQEIWSKLKALERKSNEKILFAIEFDSAGLGSYSKVFEKSFPIEFAKKEEKKIEPIIPAKPAPGAEQRTQFIVIPCDNDNFPLSAALSGKAKELPVGKSELFFICESEFKRLGEEAGPVLMITIEAARTYFSVKMKSSVLVMETTAHGFNPASVTFPNSYFFSEGYAVGLVIKKDKTEFGRISIGVEAEPTNLLEGFNRWRGADFYVQSVKPVYLSVQLKKPQLLDFLKKEEAPDAEKRIVFVGEQPIEIIEGTTTKFETNWKANFAAKRIEDVYYSGLSDSDEKFVFYEEDKIIYDFKANENIYSQLKEEALNNQISRIAEYFPNKKEFSVFYAVRASGKEKPFESDWVYSNRIELKIRLKEAKAGEEAAETGKKKAGVGKETGKAVKEQVSVSGMKNLSILPVEIIAECNDTDGVPAVECRVEKKKGLKIAFSGAESGKKLFFGTKFGRKDFSPSLFARQNENLAIKLDGSGVSFGKLQDSMFFAVPSSSIFSFIVSDWAGEEFELYACQQKELPGEKCDIAANNASEKNFGGKSFAALRPKRFRTVDLRQNSNTGRIEQIKPSYIEPNLEAASLKISLSGMPAAAIVQGKAKSIECANEKDCTALLYKEAIKQLFEIKEQALTEQKENKPAQSVGETLAPNCSSFDEKTIGYTGKTAFNILGFSKLFYAWDYDAIEKNENGWSCDARGQGYYCDAAQFSIELNKKAKLLKEIMSRFNVTDSGALLRKAKQSFKLSVNDKNKEFFIAEAKDNDSAIRIPLNEKLVLVKTESDSFEKDAIALIETINSTDDSGIVFQKANELFDLLKKEKPHLFENSLVLLSSSSEKLKSIGLTEIKELNNAFVLPFSAFVGFTQAAVQSSAPEDKIDLPSLKELGNAYFVFGTENSTEGITLANYYAVIEKALDKNDFKQLSGYDSFSDLHSDLLEFDALLIGDNYNEYFIEEFKKTYSNYSPFQERWIFANEKVSSAYSFQGANRVGLGAIDETVWVVFKKLDYAEPKNVLLRIPFDGRVGYRNEKGKEFVVRNNFGSSFSEQFAKEQVIIAKSGGGSMSIIALPEQNPSRERIALQSLANSKVFSVPKEIQSGKLLEVDFKQQKLNFFKSQAIPIALDYTLKSFLSAKIFYSISSNENLSGKAISEKDFSLAWKNLPVPSQPEKDFDGKELNEKYRKNDAILTRQTGFLWLGRENNRGLEWKSPKLQSIALQSILAMPTNKTLFFGLVETPNSSLSTPFKNQANKLSILASEAAGELSLKEIMEKISSGEACVTKIDDYSLSLEWNKEFFEKQLTDYYKGLQQKEFEPQEAKAEAGRAGEEKISVQEEKPPETQVDEKKAAKIEIFPKAETLEVNGKKLLKAIAVFEDNTTEDYSTQAVWFSSDESTVAINSNGEITGIAEGKAEITAVFGLLSNSVTIIVAKPQAKATAKKITSFEITPSVVSLETGDKKQLAATIYYEGAVSEDVTGKAEWESGDDRIAKVSSTGEIEAIAEGRTEIIAVFSNKEIAAITIRVMQKPAAEETEEEITEKQIEIESIEPKEFDFSNPEAITIRFKANYQINGFIIYLGRGEQMVSVLICGKGQTGCQIAPNDSTSRTIVAQKIRSAIQSIEEEIKTGDYYLTVSAKGKNSESIIIPQKQEIKPSKEEKEEELEIPIE